MAWLSPTGFVDSGSVWTGEAFAYDEDTETFAYASAPKGAWTNYLELTHSAIDCNKVQIWVSILIVNINAIEVDVYYNDAWQNIYSGSIITDQFVEYPIGSTQFVTSLRIRFYSTKASTGGCRVHEADFWEGVKWLVGTSNGVAGVSGIVKRNRVITGSVVGTASVAGIVKASRKIAGASTCLATVSGATKILKELAGLSACLAGVSVATKISRKVTGTIAGIASASGTISISGQPSSGGFGAMYMASI